MGPLCTLIMCVAEDGRVDSKYK